MSLKSDLGLRKDFDNPSHEALLNIHYTASQIRKKASELFRQHGLTDVQYNVLSLLKHQCEDGSGLTQVELSRMLLVNRANITTLIDRMERANLVARRSLPDDRRYNVIELTSHGLKLHNEAAVPYNVEIKQILAVLDKGEIDALMGTLQKIRERLDALGCERP